MDEGLNQAASSLIERVKGIIINPKAEWPKIEAESTSEQDIFLKYVLPLAAIGPVASLIGQQVFGISVIIATIKPSLGFSIATCVIAYVISVAMVMLIAFIANALAPSFGGQANRTNAVKLAAYSNTAGWLAGIFGLIPAIGLFSLLGLYNLYLYYTGVTPMMKVPQDKQVGYVVVLILCVIVAMFVIAPITAALVGAFGLSPVASLTDIQIR